MAFLRGMAFEKIQEISGGARREVHMQLPKGRPGLEPSGSALLRQRLGFEDFNDSTEVLEMLKGGFWVSRCPEPVHNKGGPDLERRGDVRNNRRPKDLRANGRETQGTW